MREIRERGEESEGERRRMGVMGCSGSHEVIGATEGSRRGTWRQGRIHLVYRWNLSSMLSGAHGRGGA